MSKKTAMKKYRGGLAAKGLAKIALVASSRPEKQEILRKIAAKQRAEEKTGEISMAVTAEEKAALAETQGDLNRDQAIAWCVENLAHWPRIGQVNFHPEPKGWKWVDGDEDGFYLGRYGQYNIVEETVYFAERHLTVAMTDEEFTAPVVDVSGKVEALALRLFEQRLKETVGCTEEVAKWAVEGANTFYQALGSDE